VSFDALRRFIAGVLGSGRIDHVCLSCEG